MELDIASNQVTHSHVETVVVNAGNSFEIAIEQIICVVVIILYEFFEFSEENLF